MYTLMHISDLHHPKHRFLSNREMLSCLLADRDRFNIENPKISSPNAILISGDLVQGIPLDSTDYPDALEAQYTEALSLLEALADNFLEGDRAKLIMVPGNHDIDWNMARNSMVSVSSNGQRVSNLLAMPDSPYRWSWKDLQLMMIKDQSGYYNRFEYFCDLYSRFYSSAKLAFSIDGWRYWNLFELADGNILVCAYNSCANNDCYCDCGEIPREAISESDLFVRSTRKDYKLKVAMWHHNLQGPPFRSDYLDPNLISLIIDKGYRLGLHGHQHISDLSPLPLYTSESQQMVLLSAGTLRADLWQLPIGSAWQYNIIELHEDQPRARVHVREMKTMGIFDQGRLPRYGGKSYADVEWTPEPLHKLVNTSTGGGSMISILETIEKLMQIGSFEEAISIIDNNLEILSYHGRPLLSECLFKAENWERLESHLSEVRNDDELMKSVLASVSLKHWDRAENKVKIAEKNPNFSKMLISDLRKRISAEKGMSR
jgi:hypothetical protein